MNRITAILLLVLFIWVIGCSDTENHHITHVVVIWLKEPGNDVHRRLVIEETKKLQAIPGVSSLNIGDCVKSNRAIVDSSFDVALTMTFSSKKAMTDYINHPEHVKMVKTKLMPIVKKMQVYDFQSSP
jgi:hypothetical protein